MNPRPWNWNQSQSLIRKKEFNGNQSKSTQGSINLPTTKKDKTLKQSPNYMPLIQQKVELPQSLEQVEEGLIQQESELPDIHILRNTNASSYSQNYRTESTVITKHNVSVAESHSISS